MSLASSRNGRKISSESDFVKLGSVGKLVRRHADKAAAQNKGLGLVRVRGAKVWVSLIFSLRRFAAVESLHHVPPPSTLSTLSRPDLEALLVELYGEVAALKQAVAELRDLIEQARLVRIEQAPQTGPNAMVRLLASIVGVGVETADMLVQEVLSRNLRDRRAVARYAGLTGSPDESGSKRREKGLAKAGNARVRRGLVQPAWRFLLFQKDSALAQWYRTRTAVQGVRKTVLIVALARKLLIALWRMVTTGEIPHGVVLRAAA